MHTTWPVADVHIFFFSISLSGCIWYNMTVPFWVTGILMADDLLVSIVKYSFALTIFSNLYKSQNSLSCTKLPIYIMPPKSKNFPRYSVFKHFVIYIVLSSMRHFTTGKMTIYTQSDINIKELLIRMRKIWEDDIKINYWGTGHYHDRSAVLESDHKIPCHITKCPFTSCLLGQKTSLSTLFSNTS
jgi:hypothetical protein